MITWKDYYAERQRRREEMEIAGQQRAVAGLEQRAPSRPTVGQSRKLILIVVLILLGALLAAGAGNAAAQSSEALWFVSYWDTPNLEGDPVHTESEATIDHDWGPGSPASDIGADEWSARWTSYVDFSPGTYQFRVTHDDGVRLYLGHKHILVDWNTHAARTNVVLVSLAGGRYPFAVDYFEHKGDALLRLGGQRIGDPSPTAGDVTVLTSSTVAPSQSGSGLIWQASYWNNIELRGAPALSRREKGLNHDWGTGSPGPAIGSETWSARWTSTVYVRSGIYRFTATADDGIRVWVDGILIIDAWYDSPMPTLRGERYLDHGYHDIRVEYYERCSQAVVRLSWELLKPVDLNWRVQ